jgi:hypothetical protein
LIDHQLAWVSACAALGLAGRLALIALGSSGAGTPRFYDERDYDRIATSLLDGHGFSVDGVATAFRAPGQPFFLAAVYALVGHRPVAVELVQAFLLVPIPFIAMRLARLISRHRRDAGRGETGAPIAPLLAALVALHPGLAYASASLYPVSLTAFALTVGTWLVLEAIEAGTLARAALGALMLGIAGACVTYLAPLPLLAATIALARRRVTVALTVAAVGLAPAAAWTARNAAAVGTAQLSTNGGYNLALGANDHATPRSGNWIEPDLGDTPRPEAEVDRDRVYRTIALAWIHDHPLRFAMLAVGRAIAAFDSVGRPRTAGVHAGLLATVVGALLAPMVALGLVGLVLQRREVSAWMTAAILALILAGSALTIAKPRFRFPADPLLWVFAAVAVEQILERRRSGLGQLASTAAQPEPSA